MGDKPTVKRSLNIFKSVLRKLPKLNKNTVLAGSLIFVLLLVGVWSFIFNKSNPKEIFSDKVESVADIEQAPSMGAVTSYIEGIVEHKDENGTWSRTTKDVSLTTGMGLRTTGAASKAIVLLDDGSAIRIDANSEITLESLTQTRVVISQQSGYLYNRITPSPTRIYAVHTRDAQFQSVGTAFRTIASGDEQAVEVFQNTVKETHSNLTAREGERLIIKNPSNPNKDKTKEKMDIEKLKADAFISWNRQQDEQDPTFKSELGFLSDITGPAISITEPVAGAEIEMNSNSKNGVVTIKGKTEPGAGLTVQSKSLSSTAVDVKVDPDGAFSTGGLLAPFGNSVFELIATDRVGNKTTLNVNYTFKRKTTVQKQGIALTIDGSDALKVKLNWGLVGLTTPGGVALLQDTAPGLTFSDKKRLISQGTTNEEIAKSDLKSGKKYYFAVCRYDANTNTCDVYSNEVSIVIP